MNQLKKESSSPFALSIAFAAVLLVGLAERNGNSLTTAAGNLGIEPVKEIRKGVDAWPLILNPDTPVAKRVNETLTRLNRSLAQALHDCDADYLRWQKLVGHLASGQDQMSTDWSRKIDVTMEGPRFLSLVASDEIFCGGAHPDGGRMAMVFDMSTGAQVSWTELVAKSAGASPYTGTFWDGSTAGALVLPALQKMNVDSNVDSADADCKDAFQNPQPFLIWPDAKHETLVAQPFDLPHVVQACANEIALTMDQARKLGFDEVLLSAIQQAHSWTAVKPAH
jgi:hypothetical protein